MSRYSAWLQRVAGIDPRSLVAFRVVLGLLIAWDQSIALSNVRLFYSDAGVMPLEDLAARHVGNDFSWSLHALSGAVSWQVALLMLGILAGLAVAIGWRTKLSLFIGWVLVCSLQARNPLVTFGGDTVLRMMCFWALLLPLDGKGKQPVVSLASLGLLFQAAMIYWFTAALKHGNEWTRDGSAVYYVLSADQFVRTPGLWLLPHENLCRWLSFGVWWLEWLGPFVAFLPWRTAWWRVGVILSMWLMHLGFALCLRVSWFPTAMFMVWLPFIPGMVWNRLARHWPMFEARDDHAPSAAPSFLVLSRELMAALALTTILLWNLQTLQPTSWMPRWWSNTAFALRLDQNWALFAPSPITDDGWMVLEAECNDGSRVDLLRNAQPVSFAKPYRISAEYPDGKWHKLEVNLVARDRDPVRARFGRYLAAQWSATQPEPRKVRQWTLWFIRETTLPHYHAYTPQKIKLADGVIVQTAP